MNNILNYYGKRNTAFLHARGKVATLLLTERLSPQAGEKILEIGFGTGGTLTRLSVLFPQSEFYGVEVSEIMYQKASLRFKFSGLSNLPEIKLMKGATYLPFPDNSMDKVYAESVLAIQEGDSLPYLISEIRRVLKPGGICVINETVWLQNLSVE